MRGAHRRRPPHHLDDVRALAGEVGSEHFKADVDDAGRGGEQARKLRWFAVGGHQVVRGVLMGQCFDSPYSNCVKSTSGRSPQPSQNTPPDRIFVRTRTGSNGESRSPLHEIALEIGIALAAAPAPKAALPRHRDFTGSFNGSRSLHCTSPEFIGLATVSPPPR
jgi:hypothetical protein